MKAENLAKMSIPAVLDSGCLAPSLVNLHTHIHTHDTSTQTDSQCLRGAVWRVLIWAGCSLRRAEDVLEKLLNLVDVRLDLPIEGDEGRVCARGQILQVCWLPGDGRERRLQSSSYQHKLNGAFSPFKIKINNPHFIHDLC